MNSYHQYKQSLFLVRKYLIGLAVFAFAGQLLLDRSIENTIANLLAFLTFVTTSLIIIHPRTGRVGPAFTGAIIFLSISSNSLAPMFGTLLEGHSLTYTLLQPMETYFHRSLFALVLLFAHLLAGGLRSPIKYGMSRLGANAGSKILLPSKSIWALGLFGMVILFLKFLSLPITLSKFLDGFGFLLYAPFLLLLSPYSQYANGRIERVKLLVFYSFQIGMALLFNSRMGMVAPIAVVAGGWIFNLFLGMQVINTHIIKKGLKVGLIGLLLLSQFVDLSTAILIERAHRSTRDATEQLIATFERFLNKESLAQFRKLEELSNKGTKSNSVWQENYVSNPFLSRFILIKSDDNCFYRVSFFRDSEVNALKEVTLKKILVLLPDPLLQQLGITIDKKYIGSFSIGDKIEELSGGASLGSRLTGSNIAHSYALFGWGYFPVLLALYYLIFSFFQGLFSPLNKQPVLFSGISTLALLLIFKLYTDISLDSISNIVAVILRGIWQTLFIYFIALWILKKMGFPIKTLKTFPQQTLSFITAKSGIIT